MPPRSLHDLTLADLEGLLAQSGVRSIHARTLFRAVHREMLTDLSGHPSFLPPLQRLVESHFAEGKWTMDLPKVTHETVSSDGWTRKYLLELNDGQTIETVLMGYPA